ncbi:hypothetical protein C4577_04580 [Candidatus Parcubacteria bacterium]|nr:MAG: hypothetical protein C4577_04580 [Candidatus Parcubacteria bacterium]
MEPMNQFFSQIKTLRDLCLILQEVKKDILPVLQKDLETAEFLKGAIIDYKLSLYFFLKWIKVNFKPQNILYPASGFDRIPKIVFGKNNVIHTSIEDLQDGGKKYFNQLGDGIKIVADNHNLPFESEIFDLVLLLDSTFEAIGECRDEIIRVATKGGIIILTRNIFQEDNVKDRISHYQQSKLLKILHPSLENYKKKKSNVEFFVFQKFH